MKNLMLGLFLFLAIQVADGQDIVGSWRGNLSVQGIELPVVFNFEKNEQDYKATMDSPSQGAMGIPVTTVTFENSKVHLQLTNLMIEYNGTLESGDTIVGTFTQAGNSFPLNLLKLKEQVKTIKRPQEPSLPYPYHSEDVNFENKKDNIMLAGTLTMPTNEGVFPAVILISGSGPQNRDEEILGHKPFLVLADYLTRNGIAVLRFDDRGNGKSTGDFKSSTTLDFATDVESALEYLMKREEIDKQKVGLIGHSEGGIIATMVASKPKMVNFIVLMAGTGIQGNELLLLQQELIGRAMGKSEDDLLRAKAINKKLFDLVISTENEEELRGEIVEYLTKVYKENHEMERPEGMDDKQLIEMQSNQIVNPWMLFFIRHNPAKDIEKVKCPVLALNGEKDLQVPANINLPAIKSSLEKGNNTNYTIKTIAGVNHLFQECNTGLPSEYSQLEETISPATLDLMTNWIKDIVRDK